MSWFRDKSTTTAAPATFSTMGLHDLQAARAQGATSAVVDTAALNSAATKSLAAMHDKLHTFFTPSYFAANPFATVAARFSHDPATGRNWTEPVAKAVAAMVNADHPNNGFARVVLSSVYAGGQGPWTLHFGESQEALNDVPNDIADRFDSVSDWPW